MHVVGNEGEQLYMTGVLTAEYLLRPLTMVFVVFSVEGFIRATAAFIQEEALPSVPFKLFELGQRSVQQRLNRKREGPFLPDLVEQITEPIAEIRIASSHPKEGWRAGVTIEVCEEFYDLHEMLPGVAPHRFVYVLRKKSIGTAMRGRYLYELE
jgi:hypothetical protein